MSLKPSFGALLAFSACTVDAPPRTPSEPTAPTIAHAMPRSNGAAATRAAPDRPAVAQLIAQLAAPDFATRQAAQRRLAELGNEAVPQLVKHVTSPNPEIADRVVALLGTPDDPAMRVELAAQLLSTTDPDWMERAVHLLFEAPWETGELFIERSEDSRGLQRAVFEPVASQLKFWKSRDDLFQPRYARMLQEKPEVAARELDMHLGSNLYYAEAAYWMSLDALLDYRQNEARRDEPTSQPAG